MCFVAHCNAAYQRSNIDSIPSAVKLIFQLDQFVTKRKTG